VPDPRGAAACPPWAEPHSHFTARFERLAIDLRRACSVTGAAGILRITRDEAWGIKARASARRGREVVAQLGVDETAIATRHRYLTVVAELDRAGSGIAARTGSGCASTRSASP